MGTGILIKSQNLWFSDVFKGYGKKPAWCATGNLFLENCFYTYHYIKTLKKMQKHDNELVKKSFLENNKKYNINRQVKEK